MKGRNVSRYELFEISPETIEQELRRAVCEQQQTDRLKENYSIYIISKNNSHLRKISITIYNKKKNINIKLKSLPFSESVVVKPVTPPAGCRNESVSTSLGWRW